MSKTKFTKIDVDWKHVKNACRTTVNKGKSDIEATEKFKRNLLISEHSPVRRIRFAWKWDWIKSWIATHFSRHSWECFIGTQRTDRTSVNRDESKQSALVPFEGEMNGQNAIDTARKRLCYASSKETREQMEDLKYQMHETDELKELSWAMVPNCIYRMGCPETFNVCNRYEKFIEYALNQDYYLEDLADIGIRYDVYNEWFESTYKNKK